MSRQPEGVIKDACRKIARANRLLFVQIEGKGVNGIPDTLAGHVDRTGVVFIEFKVPDKEPTEQQERRMAELRVEGQRAVCCHSVDEYKRAVGLL